MKISLVDDPAVMSNWQAFDNTRKAIMYKVEDDEKRLVRGVVMRADFPIYRYDQKFGEYYIIYKAETIRQMAEKYLLESRQNDVNLMHEKGSDVDGVQMVQYFIKGNGVSVEGFDEIADGSLFAEFHIVNDDVWTAVKDGTYKGFSLEGVFDLVPEQDKEAIETIVDQLDGAFSKFFNNSKNFTMGRLKKLKTALLKAFAEFANVTTDKGVLAWDGEDDLKVGDAVYIEDSEGNRNPAEDGDYTTSENKVIVVTDGKVSEIKDPEVDVDPAEGDAAEGDAGQALATVTTDKGDLSYDGELAVGTEVFVTGEDGEQTPAADGDYTLENGNVVKVADGKVTEIVEAEAGDQSEGESQEDEIAQIKAQRKAKALAFAMSYSDKMRKMEDALVAMGYEWPWVLDAGDDYCVADMWSEEEGYKIMRFTVTWNGDEPSMGDGVECKTAYVPVDFDVDSAFGLKAENEELRRQVAELEAQPLAKPAHDEMRTVETLAKTGDKGLDRLAGILRK